MCASGAMKEMQVISPVHRVCLDKDQERSFAMILKKTILDYRIKWGWPGQSEISRLTVYDR